MMTRYMVLIFATLFIGCVCLTSGCKKDPFNPDDLIPENYNGEAIFLLNDLSTTNRVRASIAVAGDCYASIKFGEFDFGLPSTDLSLSRVPLCEMFGDTIIPIPPGMEQITEPGPTILQYVFRSADVLLDFYRIDSTSNNWLIVKDYDETTRLLKLEFDFSFRRVNATPIQEGAPPFIRMSAGRLEVTVLDR